MKHTTKTGFLIALCIGGMPALAAANNCALNENAQVSVNFNGSDKDVTTVKTKLDAKIEEVKTLAADMHFTKFDVQSNNYSINANGNYNSENQYQYSGSASFTILPSDKAVEFMVLLTKRGFQASVNVSSYNNGNCTQTLR